MKPSLLDLLACTDCGGGFQLRADETEADGEVISGALVCPSCDRRYAIEQGLPIVLSEEERSGDVADSFGFEWETWHQGGFEEGTVFGRTIDEDVQSFFDGLAITEADLDGKLVLDAGCGSGALTIELARRYPGTTFVGLDVNPSITEVQRVARTLPNLHVVRGSIFAIPLRPSFDMVWSNGVIHHTGDTTRAFMGLTRVVAPGGRLYVWVYERKISPFAALRGLLAPFKVWDWPHKRLLTLCEALSRVTWLAVRPLAALANLPGLKDNSRWKVLTRDRSYPELTITWFDVLSPAYRDTYKTHELVSWFRISGYTDLETTWWPVGVSGTRPPS
ncbi:MAG: methyltransferase domain-containing protein [Acidimicrobiales bacterium]